MPIAFNEMETQRFGIRCARVVEPNAPLEAVNTAARKENIAFLSIRVATDDIARVQALEANGYRLMDTLVWYHTTLPGQQTKIPAPDSIEIRPAAQLDAKSVAKVAAKAFAGFFGHFHADPRLPRTACEAVYVDWARTCVITQTPKLPVLVAHAKDTIVGFLSARETSNSSADIALNAVLPQMQGRGIYGALLDHALQQIATAGYREVTISTQINNIPVQKAWGKRGFRIHSSFYTLHKWLDTPDH